jgi:serine/threonine protein kinase
MVIEFIESDLKKILNSVHRGTILEEDHIITMMYNSFCALNYIHSANLLHRDLKPGNLLVDSNCCVRLCDFGLARSQPAKFSDPRHIFQVKKALRGRFKNPSTGHKKREFDAMDAG